MRDLYFLLYSYGYKARSISHEEVVTDGLSPRILDELSRVCDLRTLKGDLTVHSYGMSDEQVTDYIFGLIGCGKYSHVFDGHETSRGTLKPESAKIDANKKIRKALVEAMGVANITVARTTYTRDNNLIRRRD